MKVADIANTIYINIGSPTSTSVPAIAFWVRSQVGKINNLLFEDFTITGPDYEIKDGDEEISEEVVAVIEKLYRVYDYSVQIRSQMNALATDSILSFREADGSSFTRTNRNEISKTLASLQKLEMEECAALIGAYRVKKASPSQVTGDDIIAGWYGQGTSYQDASVRTIQY